MSLTRLVCGFFMLPKMLATLHSVTLLDMRTMFLNMTIYFVVLVRCLIRCILMCVWAPNETEL